MFLRMRTAANTTFANRQMSRLPLIMIMMISNDRYLNTRPSFCILSKEFVYKLQY